MDADAVKTYVELRMLDARHLFEINLTRDVVEAALAESFVVA